MTSNVQLNPLEVRELFQAPELTDPAGAASLDDRLFRHDYLFTVPEQVFGVANINDLNLTIGSRLLEDILQLTFGLFEDGVLSGNLIAGLATDPPGGDRATISFSDLVPGTQYIMRVAGVLNGFAVIPGTGGTFGWHGQYQGNIAVVPLPGAVLLFLTALGGLGIVRLRGRKSA